ncbi:helix-turn-helix domain-containing protein [Streptomyces sp. NPDC059866]|uniref:helix-turn-helix domain-containing protein n=1 Tax=Streptomyces sp. NPDC059866 TaxID=3346978 RepID=UPI003668E5AD
MTQKQLADAACVAPGTIRKIERGVTDTLSKPSRTPSVSTPPACAPTAARPPPAFTVADGSAGTGAGSTAPCAEIPCRRFQDSC